MKQKDYLNALLSNLKGIDEDYKTEILETINEHFKIGLSKGKSEEDIARALGDPQVQSKFFILEQSLETINERQKIKNYLQMLFCFFSLGTVGLGSAIISIFTIAIWALFLLLGLIIIFSGVILFFSVVLKLSSEKPLVTTLTFFVSIAIASLGALVTIWISNLLKPIKGLIVKLAGRLIYKYKLLSEVN